VPIFIFAGEGRLHNGTDTNLSSVARSAASLGRGFRR
jgi:hypothetical protein